MTPHNWTKIPEGDPFKEIFSYVCNRCGSRFGGINIPDSDLKSIRFNSNSNNLIDDCDMEIIRHIYNS